MFFWAVKATWKLDTQTHGQEKPWWLSKRAPAGQYRVLGKNVNMGVTLSRVKSWPCPFQLSDLGKLSNLSMSQFSQLVWRLLSNVAVAFPPPTP